MIMKKSFLVKKLTRYCLQNPCFEQNSTGKECLSIKVRLQVAAALRKAVRKELLPQTYIEHVQRGCHRVLRSLEWEGEDLRADPIMCAERLEVQESENY